MSNTSHLVSRNHVKGFQGERRNHSTPMGAIMPIKGLAIQAETGME